MTDDAHPGRAADVKSFTHNTHSIMPRLNSDTNMPRNEITRSGKAVNEVTPSNASASILRNGYFDSPANRSARS
jgi:hypothetical protein